MATLRHNVPLTMEARASALVDDCAGATLHDPVGLRLAAKRHLPQLPKSEAVQRVSRIALQLSLATQSMGDWKLSPAQRWTLASHYHGQAYTEALLAVTRNWTAK